MVIGSEPTRAFRIFVIYVTNTRLPPLYTYARVAHRWWPMIWPNNFLAARKADMNRTAIALAMALLVGGAVAQERAADLKFGSKPVGGLGFSGQDPDNVMAAALAEWKRITGGK